MYIYHPALREESKIFNQARNLFIKAKQSPHPDSLECRVREREKCSRGIEGRRLSTWEAHWWRRGVFLLSLSLSLSPLFSLSFSFSPSLSLSFFLSLSLSLS